MTAVGHRRKECGVGVASLTEKGVAALPVQGSGGDLQFRRGYEVAVGSLEV